MLPFGSRPSLRSRLREYLNDEVGEDILLEAEMLLLSFATGIGDATTYSEYRVFTANHTGNTLLIAVGITEQSAGASSLGKLPIPLPLIAISLSMFIAGAWVTGQLGLRFGCRRRWWLLLNSFFQMLLVLTASMLQTRIVGWNEGPSGAAASEDVKAVCSGAVNISPLPMLVVALLAFSAGGQVAVARSLHMTEITTANATSAYVDLLIDKRLYQKDNRRRNRRLCFVASLCLGSFSGGFAYQKMGSFRTLFTSAVGKMVVTTMLLYNKGGIFDKVCLCCKTSLIQSEESSDLDLSINHTDKASSTLVSSRGTGAQSEKSKYAEFDYGGKQAPTPREAVRDRDSMARYSMGSYLDFATNQLFIQIPSWTITTGTTVHRNIPGK